MQMTVGQAILTGFRHNYINDPETKLVATRCAVCQKDLKDSVSVERGIGPDCYGKYYCEPGGITPEQRAEANAIVKYIAVKAKGDEAIIACKALEDLGFVALSGRIARRVCQIRIEAHVAVEHDYACSKFGFDHYHVFTPKSFAFLSTMKANVDKAQFVLTSWGAIDTSHPAKKPGWSFLTLPGNRKGWVIPVSFKPGLWKALNAGFAGLVGVNPEGRMFVIGGADAAKKVTETVPGMPGFTPPAKDFGHPAPVEELPTTAKDIADFLDQHST
jgi:hypothetical protein